MVLTAETMESIRSSLREWFDARFKPVEDQVSEIDDIVRGNNGEGLKSKMAVVETDVKHIKEWMHDMKSDVRKGVWIVIGILITQLINIGLNLSP